jgi:RimJ/RimL family protein N-acetyltransferase
MTTVETERLILCPFDCADAEEYFHVVCDADIRKYVQYASTFSKESTLMLISAYVAGDFKNDFYLEIREKATQKIVGAIIAIRVSATGLDVSYLIGRNFRDRGYMKEALAGFINYLITSPEHFYSYLEFTIENENIMSQHVVKSFGATPFRVLSKSMIWRIKLNQFELL